MQGVIGVQLALIGLSHHRAPIEVREKLSCPEHTLPAALQALGMCAGVREAVILSTCNRMEIYLAMEEGGRDAHFNDLVRHLAAYHNVAASRFEPYLYRHHDQEAVAHLLRVASGLDSLVLGEAQILGQVRHALRVALEVQAAGGTLEKLFTQALAAGKRVQNETGLGRGGFSIGHAAVDLAGRIFDDVSRAHVLILGAGKMSELTAKHLVRQGVKFVVVANRTYERAVAMAERLGGRAIQFEEAFRTELAHSDIVIASTASPHPILRRENLLPALRQRRGKPLFLIDIAVPRDIDPDVNDLNNVFLYNIDDLQHYLAEYAQARASEAGRAESLVEEETTRFMTWYRSREAAPVITAFRSHLDGIRNQYLEIFSGRLAHLSDRDRRTIEAMAEAMMGQVAREPILRLKREANGSREGSETPTYDLLTAAAEIFGLQPPITDPDGAGSPAVDPRLLSAEEAAGTLPVADTAVTRPTPSCSGMQNAEVRS
jgi:glutamyl-tRNA reductase